MILRFHIQEGVYNPGVPTMCNPTQIPTAQSDYDGITGSLNINGTNIAGTPDLGSGWITQPFPLTIGDVTVNSLTIENGIYFALDVDVPNIWDSFEFHVQLDRADAIALDRKFTIYGYDLGRNPNVAVTNNHEEFYLVLLPSEYPAVFATTGSIFPAIGVEFEITADNPGPDGNGILIGPGDGIKTLNDLMNDWNTANPTNTGTLTYLQGGGYVPTALEGAFGPTAGGANASIANVAYANFIGWRQPFTDDLWLFANYSNLQDRVHYDNTTRQLGTTHSLLLPCYNEDEITMTSEVFEYDGCGVAQVVDTCVFGPRDILAKLLIPAFECGVGCEDCCEDGCIVTINDNYVQFIVDVSAIDPLYVNDTLIVSVEEVTALAKVLDACGNEISMQSLPIPLNPIPPLEDTRVDIEIPAAGDYIIECKFTSEAFECVKKHTITGCEPYKVTKKECDTYVLKNLSLGAITFSVESFTKEKMWEEVIAPQTLERCQEYEIKLTTDGVYRININDEVYNVLVIDCKFKACFVDYTKKRVCNPKADCACGGNCNGLCKKIPMDLYDFAAFSILTFNYFALLNDLYVKNFVFTIFQPSDLDNLFTIKQYLERVEEYCGNCKEVVNATKPSNCGCGK